jgi:CPA2 family monovalent cation:H+ antiporter-2
VPHETALIATIAIGLAFAFVGGVIAVRLRLPPLVGYLLAGIAVGPFTPGFVADADLAPQLAEIGVILLMFGVGVHFSIRDLMSVRWIALPGALAQIAVATALGAGVARLWGWSLGAGLVFGLALSVASTVVLLRALEHRGRLHTGDGRIAVGWLIVEDLVMVLALVLLPALARPMAGLPAANGAGPLWIALGVTLGQVAIFVALMLVVGTRAFPWLLDRVERTGSRELFRLAVISLALGVAFGSAKLFGVSFALGAFFAGMVINVSDHSHRAATDLQPLQDAFGVLFFVAVGMLFDPAILTRHPFQTLLVVAIIVVGKSLAALGIVLALRYPLRTALAVSAALAQIGEFSFILAGLGVSLGVLPPAGQSLIVAGALLSISLNPLVFSIADRCGVGHCRGRVDAGGGGAGRSLERAREETG